MQRKIIKEINNLGDYNNDISDIQFESCDFSNGNWSNLNFENVRFNNCNLSFVQCNKTSFRKVTFDDCKLLAVFFDKCNPFGFKIQFIQCILNQSSFTGLKMRNMHFESCQLLEVDFAETDLSLSVFENCNLAGANFDYSILEEADLSSAKNYSINPMTNKISKAKFSYPEVLSLLRVFELKIEP